MKKLKLMAVIFGQFLLLGCISFGGPAAHIGYFQKTFVEKLTWLSNAEYANLVSLSQILPGPGSSQIGFAIGLHKAGLLGALLAFVGFTLPSFVLMYCIAVAVDFNNPQAWLFGLIHGLKLLAVVVVFEAIQSMAKSFCKTKLAIGITFFSALILVLASSAWLQIFVILAAAAVGMLSKRATSQTAPDTSEQKLIVWPLVLFIGLFVGLFFLSLVLNSSSTNIHLFASFFQSGSLVFGGGHVVLPLLQANLGDTLSNEQFLFGYSAAQGVPGPMFTIAAFMGTLLTPNSPLLGAFLATIAIFMPGFLLVLSLKGVWQNLLNNKYFSGATWGINAGVVGLLIATLYHPILTSALNNVFDLIYIVLGLVCVKLFKLHILWLIGLFSLIGVATEFVLI